MRGHAGEVSHRGAELTVRFEPGVDAERKAARLESELQSVRRHVPVGGSLRVAPVQQGGDGASAVVWLPGAPGETPSALVQALLSLPAVRDVQVAGQRRQEVRKTKAAVYGTAPADDEVRRVGRRPLGVWRGGTTVLQVLDGEAMDADPDRRMLLQSGVPVAASSIYDTELWTDEPRFTVRVGGEAGQALLLFREYDASPLALSASVRDVLEAHGLVDEARWLIDEAEPLGRLLRRLGWGLAVAMLAGLGAQLFLFGRQAWPQIFVLPVALSAVLNVCRLTEIDLDVTTLPALLPALGAAQLFQILRMNRARPWPLLWIGLSAGVLPVAVVLAGGPLAAFLGPPARLFALAMPAACLAVMLLPVLSSRPVPRAQRALKFLWRRPWAVLLGVVSLIYVLLVVFGAALSPHPGRLTAATADLVLSLRFPDGFTLAEAERELQRAERHLAGRDEVLEHWSLVSRGSAWIRLTVRPEDRDVPRLKTLAARFESQLAHIGASLNARPLAGIGSQEPIQFDESMRDEPETDVEATFYRFILRSTDLSALQVAFRRLEESASTTPYPPPSNAIIQDWGRPMPRFELVPLPGTTEAQISRSVDQMRRRTLTARAFSAGRLPGSEEEIRARFQTDDTLRDPRQAPDRRALARLALEGEATPVSIDDLFEIREGLTSPVVKRQDGSFVLPVTVRFSFLAAGQRDWARTSLHWAMRETRLPDGVGLLVPSLNLVEFGPKEQRLFAVASILPLFFFGLAACRLGSISLGLSSLLPSLLGVAVAAPAAMAMRGHLDELMLFTGMAALIASLPLAMEVTAHLRVESTGPMAPAPGYRWMAERLPAVVVGALMWVLLFAVPTLGVDPERQPWAPGLTMAAWVGFAAVVGSCVALPVLLRSVDLVRLRDREAERLRAHPPSWSEPGTATLAVRNLNKIYGNGFQALRSMEFELQPGIIGLLGPNGAGKTTLLRTLCGLLEPTRGQVLFRGVPVGPENLPQYRRLVGFLPQSFNAYDGMVVADFLDYWALELGLGDRRQRRREIEHVLDQVGLADAGGKAVRQLSGGMRRRIGIARALLGSPPILIVDEPTTGLDVESRNRLRESLLTVASERIILFSTHIAGDVAATASRILMMNRGTLLFDGTAGDLMDQAHGRIFECMVADEELREFSKRFRVTTRVRTLEGIRVRAVAGTGQEPAGTVVRPNLEEAYLAKLELTPQGDGKKRQGSLLDLEL